MATTVEANTGTPDLVPLSVVAHRAGVPWAHVWHAALEGTLRAERHRGRWYVTPAEARRWIAAQAAGRSER